MASPVENKSEFTSSRRLDFEAAKESFVKVDKLQYKTEESNRQANSSMSLLKFAIERSARELEALRRNRENVK